MFSDWQAQQKAQKEAERRAKKEAEAALQGYRRSGLSEEETKLAALREQERLQKLNAEQRLHGYRSQLTEEEAKLAAQRQEELRRKQEYEEQLRTNGVVSAHDPTAPRTSSLLTKDSGVVSALAATYTSPSAPPRSESSFVTSAMKEAPRQPDFSSAAIAPTESVTTEVNVAAVTDALDTTIIADDPAPVSDLPLMAPESAPVPTSNAVNSSSISPTPVAPVPVPPASEPTLPPLPPVATIPAFVQSSVVFMFGILTADDITMLSFDHQSEFVSGYLKKADELVKSVIDASPSFQTILSSLEYPVATSIQKDHYRTDVHRTLVTVRIDYKAPNTAASNEFQSQVIECVRIAISNGSFTKGGASLSR